MKHDLPAYGNPFYRYNVMLDWDADEVQDPKTASSWASDLEETRARAELALRLMIDTVRLENTEPLSSLDLLSARPS